MEYDPIKKYYVNACSAIIKKLYPELTLSPTGNSHEPVQELVVEYPDSRQGYGDIALPCFFLSKKLKKPPFQIAKEIAHACSQSLDELGVLQATAIGGYVNFSIAPQFLLSCYQEFSLRPFKQKNERVLVEYSSPNANKPLHLGHVRNNALGMSISLLLERIGYEVIRVMLVNDKGVGVAKTIYAYQKTGRKQPPKKPDHYIGDLYVAAEGLLKDEPHANQIIQQLIAGWEKNDPVIRDDWKKLRNWVMEGFFKTYQDYGCTFDIIYYESEIYQEADEILKEGINKGVFKKEQNGA
ncbi:MAG: arginine--tRNA ligase [Candidatus Woesearchaeota archaeon]